MKNSFHLFLIVLISVVGISEVCAQELKLSGLQEKIESLVPPAVNDTTPGLVIGVVHNGELIFKKGYGMANLSYGIPNNTEMIYNLGSVSKQFLGYAFAMLQAEGKLNVDDPVGKYLDDWPEFDQEVTIRHLLTHTSGYREAYTISNLAGRIVEVDRLSREECLEVVRRQPELEFEPGSRYSYNSTAWVILAEILEEATGQSADEWVKVQIFDPLGMDHTYIESFVGEVMPNAAESYFHDPNRGYGNSKSNRAIFGAADICSSIDDMSLWLAHFQTQVVGNEAIMNDFLTPYTLTDGTNSEYGFGIQNRIHKGLKLYSHTGGHESFATQLRYYPEHDLGIITVSNYGGRGWIPTNQIAEYVLEEFMTFPEEVEHKPFKISSKVLKRYAGLYISPTRNSTNELELKNDTLTIWGGTQLIPISENRFYSNTWGGQFELIEVKGQPTQLIIHGDSKSSYTKVEDWTPSKADLEAYVSDYYSAEIEAIYHMVIKDDQLVIEHRWLGEMALTPVTKDLFRSDWGMFVEFTRSPSGKILGFNLSSGRTLNVFFKRRE